MAGLVGMAVAKTGGERIGVIVGLGACVVAAFGILAMFSAGETEQGGYTCPQGSGGSCTRVYVES